MPNYEFFCHACKKMFSKILTIAAHEKAKITCPHCGNQKIEQRPGPPSTRSRRRRGVREGEGRCAVRFRRPRLPDGHVLILGGYGVDGKIVQTAEMIYFTGTL